MNGLEVCFAFVKDNLRKNFGKIGYCLIFFSRRYVLFSFNDTFGQMRRKEDPTLITLK
jgi:hypothetical protein